MFEAAIAAAAANAPQTPQTVAMIPGLQVHIDGDYLAYFASGNDETTAGQARLNALSLISEFQSRIGAESVIMHNTAKGCQKGERYLIATVKPYQEQRTSGRKPKNQPYLQDWLQQYEGLAFRAKNWTTREADDGIGACAHYGIDSRVGYIGIATADKDMRMLPGLHIDWTTRELVRVMPGDYDVVGSEYMGVSKGIPVRKPGKQYGLKFFWAQMLMGDATDNCPGLESIRTNNPDGSFKSFKKIGEGGAYGVLSEARNTVEAYEAVRREYVLNYNSSLETALDRFCEQAALMWMRLGNDAAVGDFARHNGHSRINHTFDSAMWAAVERLETRVHLARTTINSFRDSDDPLCTDGATGQ